MRGTESGMVGGREDGGDTCLFRDMVVLITRAGGYVTVWGSTLAAPTHFFFKINGEVVIAWYAMPSFLIGPTQLMLRSIMHDLGWGV